VVAEAPRPEPIAKPRFAAAANPPLSLAAAGEATAAIANPGSNAPITPIKVRTVAVKLVPPKHVLAAAVTKPAPQPAKQETVKPEEIPSPAAAITPAPRPAPGVLGALPAMVVAAATKNVAVSQVKAEELVSSVPASAPHHVRSGWIIQVGAYESEAEAKEKLSSAQSKAAALLQKTEAYTERTTKGEKTYYRARFAGFDRDRAEAACKRLKREDIACMALKI
jgi:D-alanyl-D-alanine carboxypeptidase